MAALPAKDGVLLVQVGAGAERDEARGEFRREGGEGGRPQHTPSANAKHFPKREPRIGEDCCKWPFPAG